MLQHNEFEKNPFREGGNCKKIPLQSDFFGKMSLCRGKKLRESPSREGKCCCDDYFVGGMMR